MGGLERDEASRGSSGGTEAMARELERRLPGELLERFQIVTSQVKTLAPDKIRVFWCHCTPYAWPAVHLANGGWQNFDRYPASGFRYGWDRRAGLWESIVRSSIAGLPLDG
jgi:hypothetical protein